VKVALVTGANTGIGLAIAERLLADGYALGFATVDTTHEEPLERLRGAYGKERLHWAWGDLADASIPGRLVEETVGALGRIDVLVNNAGIVLLKNALDTSLDEWSNIVNINLRACGSAAAMPCPLCSPRAKAR
jgi:2-deoxy-D-gluconate 3-dehydrogenase